MTEFIHHHHLAVYGIAFGLIAGFWFFSLMYRSLVMMVIGSSIGAAIILISVPQYGGLKMEFKLSGVKEYFTIHDEMKLVKDDVYSEYQYLVSYGEYEERSLVKCASGNKLDALCIRGAHLIPEYVETVDQANTYMEAMAEKHKEKSSFLDDYFWLLILLIVLLLLM